MNLSDIRKARQAGGLHVVTFNVWVGQPVKQLKANLRKLVQVLGKPHVIILQEAWRWDKGTIKGYTAVRPKQNHNDQDKSTIFLVRNDGKILHAGARRVRGGQWMWNGNDKPARVYPRVIVRFPELGRTVWDVIGVHRIPRGPNPHIKKNAEAWLKEHQLLVKWARRIHRRRPGRVIVLAADWNTRLKTEMAHPASLSTLIDDLPNPTDFGVLGIDGFVVVNGMIDHLFELNSKFGSDGHHPVSANVYAYPEGGVS